MNQFWCVFCPQRSHWPSNSPSIIPERGGLLCSSSFSTISATGFTTFSGLSWWCNWHLWGIEKIQRIVGLGLGLGVVWFSCEVKTSRNPWQNPFKRMEPWTCNWRTRGLKKMITANWCVNVRWSLGEEFNMSYDETSICNIKRIEYLVSFG